MLRRNILKIICFKQSIWSFERTKGYSRIRCNKILQLIRHTSVSGRLPQRNVCFRFNCFKIRCVWFRIMCNSMSVWIMISLNLFQLIVILSCLTKVRKLSRPIMTRRIKSLGKRKYFFIKKSISTMKNFLSA